MFLHLPDEGWLSRHLCSGAVRGLSSVSSCSSTHPATIEQTSTNDQARQGTDADTGPAPRASASRTPTVEGPEREQAAVQAGFLEEVTLQPSLEGAQAGSLQPTFPAGRKSVSFGSGTPCTSRRMANKPGREDVSKVPINKLPPLPS